MMQPTPKPRPQRSNTGKVIGNAKKKVKVNTNFTKRPENSWEPKKIPNPNPNYKPPIGNNK